MEKWELQQRQSLPLELKVQLTERRIIEWYEYFEGNVYVSFSGGVDSVALLHQVRSIYPHVPAVYSDTGLEYPALKSFAKMTPNTDTVRPDMSFKQVIEVYGFPIISKAQAMAIRKLRTQNLTEKYRNKLLYGDERGQAGMLSKKWHYLLNAPFKISEECCNIMKKKPLTKHTKITGRYPITGEMADEGMTRTINTLRVGCNGFNLDHPKSMPMSFWKKTDVLNYIQQVKAAYCDEIYGEIVKENGIYITTKEQRTGCIWCGFGCHMEKGENRFQRLKRMYPDLHRYCIEDLCMGEVLDYIGVKYE